MAAAAGRGAGLGGEVEEDDQEEDGGRHRVTQHVHRDVGLQHQAVRLGDRPVHYDYYYVLSLFQITTLRWRTHDVVGGADQLARQQEGHARAETVEDLGDGGGRDALLGREPGAGDGEGRAAHLYSAVHYSVYSTVHATHHDVGHPVEDGADVAADGEQGVARVVDVERHTSAHRQRRQNMHKV